MANNYTKTMRQALQEARDYRDTTEGGPGSGPQKGGKKFSSSEIKKAYGILNDPRYKQGNYTGAAKAINKLAPGLADHPDVKNAMKRANENLDLPATGDTTTSNASQEVEQVDEAKFTPAQVSALKDKYGKLGPGAEKNAVQMDKLAKMMSKYSKSHLSQLADMGVPMVSKVAKELMKEEVAEAVTGLPKGRALMYIIKTDKNTARRIKSFLADHGELYPIHIDDDDSGQITLDAYDDRDAAHDAAQAIAKKFNVKVRGTR